MLQIISYLVCAAALALWVVARIRGKKTAAQTVLAESGFDAWFSAHSGTVYKAAFAVILLVAALTRLWLLGDIPYGLNQDEASIAYDSFAIGNYGYDRNGYHLPVYPIAHGDGHGPLYTYMSIPIIRLLGLSVFSARLTNALLSVAASVFMYLLLKRLTQSRPAALIGFAVAATAPVLIMSARWAHDSTPGPSLFVIGIYLFIRAAESQKTLSYGLTAAFFALICYSYGPAAFVVAPFLVLTCVYLLCHKKIKVLQLLISGAAFLAIIAPLALFMHREALGLPAINAFISFPRFTVSRASGVLRDTISLGSFWSGITKMIFQPNDFIYNTAPGFGTTYLFTAPVIICGAAVLIVKTKIKEYSHYIFIAAYCVSAVFLCGIIEQNVNRISIVFPAVIILIALAAYEIAKRSRLLALALCLCAAVSFAGFSAYYFGDGYKKDMGNEFFVSFGDAVEYAAEKTDGTIYVSNTSHNIPHVSVLFFTETPPAEFYETVKYYNPNGEWRWAESFGRFVFYGGYFAPLQAYPTGVYIVHNSEIGLFDPEVFGTERFENYSVMYPAEVG
ncbi:MAG: glycosyltransferase family 39 protein [Oscillospiraceae bacterium]|nr:glycosyltransferase family 39 protein [Oscillospiraceae bacterium]